MYKQIQHDFSKKLKNERDEAISLIESMKRAVSAFKFYCLYIAFSIMRQRRSVTSFVKTEIVSRPRLRVCASESVFLCNWIYWGNKGIMSNPVRAMLDLITRCCAICVYLIGCRMEWILFQLWFALAGEFNCRCIRWFGMARNNVNMIGSQTSCFQLQSTNPNCLAPVSYVISDFRIAVVSVGGVRINKLAHCSCCEHFKWNGSLPRYITVARIT
jgi:hypothetical protein